MDTAHSDGHSYDFLCNLNIAVVDESEKAIRNFASVLKDLDFTQLSKANIISLSDMLKEISGILKKLKTAYIFGTYHPDTACITRLNRIFKILQERILFLNSQNHPKSNHTGISNKQKYSLTRLKSIYRSIIDIAGKIIDTDQKFFCYCANYKPCRSVLVGTLRNPSQLKLALSCGFYHIPESLVSNPEDIGCIAIYQSKNLFGNGSGIKYYGRVSDFKRVKRNEIKESPSDSHEPYIRFEVEGWNMLKSPITADYLGDACVTTTLYQLMKCKNSGELLLCSHDEFILYEFMKRNAFSDKRAICSFDSGEVLYNGRTFDVTVNGRAVCKITNEQFFKSGVSAVKTIMEHKPFVQRQNLT